MLCIIAYSLFCCNLFSLKVIYDIAQFFFTYVMIFTSRLTFNIRATIDNYKKGFQEVMWPVCHFPRKCYFGSQNVTLCKNNLQQVYLGYKNVCKQIFVHNQEKAKKAPHIIFNVTMLQ